MWSCSIQANSYQNSYRAAARSGIGRIALRTQVLRHRRGALARAGDSSPERDGFPVEAVRGVDACALRELSVRAVTIPRMGAASYCETGKVVYRDEDDAVDWPTRIRHSYAKKGKSARLLHPYPCDLCGNWHLGRSQTGYTCWQTNMKRQERLAQLDRVRLAKAVVSLDIVLTPVAMSRLLRHQRDGLTSSVVMRRLQGVPCQLAVLSRLVERHRSAILDFRWLSDEDTAAHALWRQVGLTGLRIGRPTQAGGRDSWKSTVVEQWLEQNPERRVVWLDKD